MGKARTRRGESLRQGCVFRVSTFAIRSPYNQSPSLTRDPSSSFSPIVRKTRPIEFDSTWQEER